MLLVPPFLSGVSGPCCFLFAESDLLTESSSLFSRSLSESQTLPSILAVNSADREDDCKSPPSHSTKQTAFLSKHETALHHPSVLPPRSLHGFGGDFVCNSELPHLCLQRANPEINTRLKLERKKNTNFTEWTAPFQAQSRHVTYRTLTGFGEGN